MSMYRFTTPYVVTVNGYVVKNTDSIVEAIDVAYDNDNSMLYSWNGNKYVAL